MTTREIIAANVRARLAWHGLSATTVAKHLDLSQQGLSGKLTGTRRFTTDELDILAELFGLADPGPLFRAPEGWMEPEVSRSMCTSVSPGQLRLRFKVAA